MQNTYYTFCSHRPLCSEVQIIRAKMIMCSVGKVLSEIQNIFKLHQCISFYAKENMLPKYA
jgi:hypothetical protein